MKEKYAYISTTGEHVNEVVPKKIKIKKFFTHGEFNYFCHKIPDTQTYRISNAETGMCILDGQKTIKGAIEAAHKLLDRIGEQNVKSTIIEKKNALTEIGFYEKLNKLKEN